MTKIAFKTIGCRMNQAETTELEAAFRAAGFRVVKAGECCDVCIVHGCAVTATAERESLRHARTLKRRHPGAFIVVAGCIAEIRQHTTRPADAGIDLLVGQAQKRRLPLIVSDALGLPLPVGQPAEADLAVEGWRAGERTRALLKVQDGCGFGCAYCIVPLLRPAPVSRPAAVIVDTVRRLGSQGCLEVVLTGANLGCYHDGKNRLPELLETLLAIPRGPRIRISSIESSTVESRVIDIMANSKRFSRYLHLPLQSGADTVLRRMQRRYTAAEYRERIAYARHKLGVFGLGADIIVGFPGETDAEFESTASMVNELPFTNLHVFPFSPRPGTAAAAMRDSVPQSVKRERVNRLNQIGAGKRVRFAESLIGRQVTVIVEKISRGVGTGWTGEYLPARVTGSGLKVNRAVEAQVRGNDDDVVLLDAR